MALVLVPAVAGVVLIVAGIGLAAYSLDSPRLETVGDPNRHWRLSGIDGGSSGLAEWDLRIRGAPSGTFRVDEVWVWISIDQLYRSGEAQLAHRAEWRVGERSLGVREGTHLVENVPVGHDEPPWESSDRFRLSPAGAAPARSLTVPNENGTGSLWIRVSWAFDLHVIEPGDFSLNVTVLDVSGRFLAEGSPCGGAPCQGSLVGGGVLLLAVAAVGWNRRHG